MSNKTLYDAIRSRRKIFLPTVPIVRADDILEQVEAATVQPIGKLSLDNFFLEMPTHSKKNFRLGCLVDIEGDQITLRPFAGSGSKHIEYDHIEIFDRHEPPRYTEDHLHGSASIDKAATLGTLDACIKALAFMGSGDDWYEQRDVKLSPMKRIRRKKWSNPAKHYWIVGAVQ